MISRDNCLDTAKRLINGDRKDDYGDAYLMHERIAHLWMRYLDFQVNIKAQDVAAMMILLKIARLRRQSKDDTWVDICGYAALGSEMEEEGE